MKLPDSYKTFHPTAAEYTFLWSMHGTFSRIYHMLDHKTSLRKFKQIEMSSIFLDHESMELEVNNGRKLENSQCVKIKQHILNNHWIKEKVKRNLKNLETKKKKLKHSMSKFIVCSKSSSKRDYNDKCLY